MTQRSFNGVVRHLIQLIIILLLLLLRHNKPIYIGSEYFYSTPCSGIKI